MNVVTKYYDLYGYEIKREEKDIIPHTIRYFIYFDNDNYIEFHDANKRTGFLRTYQKSIINTKSKSIIEKRNVYFINTIMGAYELNDFYHGLSKICIDGKYGFRDKNRIVISCIYDAALDFSEGYAAVKKNGKWGYINKYGEKITPFIYDAAYNFKDGLARIKKNGLYGFINKNGEEVIKPKYKFITDFYNGLAIVNNEYSYDVIDKNENIISTFGKYYSFVSPFVEDRSIVCHNDLYGFVNISKEEICKCKYDCVFPFSEGYAVVKLNGLYGFINKNGEEVIKPKYDYASSFKDGLAVIRKNNGYGYIDKNDEVIIDFIYEEVLDFSEGYAAVKKNGKWGYINKYGKEVIPFIYDEANSFVNGYAVIKKDNMYNYIDTKGNFLSFKVLQDDLYKNLPCTVIDCKSMYTYSYYSNNIFFKTIEELKEFLKEFKIVEKENDKFELKYEKY